jgi:hypothetical protein
MLDEGARICSTLWYRTELFDAGTIDRMIRGTWPCSKTSLRTRTGP